MINLFEWDSIFAIDYTTLNSAIKTSGTFPNKFKYEIPSTKTKRSIEGCWGDWKVTGGDDCQLYITCPVTSGKYLDGDKQYTLDNGQVEIQVELKTINANVGINSEYKLSILNGKNKSDDNPNVLVKNIHFKSIDDEIEKDSLESTFKIYLNNSSDIINFVFATVMLNQKAKMSSLQWLKPTSFSYACTNDTSQSKENGIFAILSTTENRPSSKLSRIDPGLIKLMNSDINSVYACDLGLIMRNILIKGAARCGAKWREEDFQYNTEAGYPCIKNIRTIVMDDLKVANDKVVAPTIEKGNFQLAIIGNKIELSIKDAEFFIDFQMIGINMPFIGHFKVHLTIKQSFSLKLAKEKDTGDIGLVTVLDTEKQEVRANIYPSTGVENFKKVMEWVEIGSVVLALVPAAGWAGRWAVSRIASRGAAAGAEAAMEIELTAPLLQQGFRAIGGLVVEESVATSGATEAIANMLMIAWRSIVGGTTGLGTWLLANQWRLCFFGTATFLGTKLSKKTIPNSLKQEPTLEMLMQEFISHVKWTGVEGEWKPEEVIIDNALIIRGKWVKEEKEN